MTRAAQRLLLVSLSLAACGGDARQDIAYSSNKKTLGDWPAEKRLSEPAAPAEPTKLPPQQPAPSRRDAGQDPAQDGDGGEMDVEPSGTTDKPDAGSAGSGADTGVRLSFSVLTEVQHMRKKLSDPDFDDDARGPKNMGAIWIERPDGTFVRTLEVWRRHKERSRHLVAYNEACKCPTPDVMATATLASHKAHMVNWDMTDRKGAKVEEGKYTLHIEVSDYDVDKADKADPDAENAVLSLDFDTKDAPSEVSSEDSEFFSDVKLELFAP